MATKDSDNVLVQFSPADFAGLMQETEAGLRAHYPNETIAVMEVEVPTAFKWCELHKAWVLEPVAPDTEISVGSRVKWARSYPAFDSCDNSGLGQVGVVVSINDPQALTYFWDGELPAGMPTTKLACYDLG